MEKVALLFLYLLLPRLYLLHKKVSVTVVAAETNHTIRAVDHYLKDFNRVKTLYLDDKTPDYIHLVTNLSLNVIAQYINIINQYVKVRELTE